jgi:hypothetical protein
VRLRVCEYHYPFFSSIHQVIFCNKISSGRGQKGIGICRPNPPGPGAIDAPGKIIDRHWSPFLSIQAKITDLHQLQRLLFGLESDSL